MAMVVMVIVRPVFWIRVLINAYVTITKADRFGQVAAFCQQRDLGTCAGLPATGSQLARRRACSPLLVLSLG